MNENINKIGEVLKKIKSVSDEQRNRAEQINAVIAEIDRSVNDVAANAVNLSSWANELRKLCSTTYKLSENLLLITEGTRKLRLN